MLSTRDRYVLVEGFGFKTIGLKSLGLKSLVMKSESRKSLGSPIHVLCRIH